MTPRSSGTRRGQPIVVLALILTGWVGFRGVVWAGDRADPAAGPENTPQALPSGSVVGREAQSPDPVRTNQGAARAASPRPDLPALERHPSVPVAPPVWSGPAIAVPVAPSVEVAPMPIAGGPVRQSTPRVAAGHQMLFMAGLAQLPMAAIGGAGPVAQADTPGAARPGRWSADAWVLLRQGGNGFNLPGAGLPGANLPSGAYGASQAGAVLRYRLAPSSGHRPALYLRGTSALQSPRGEELAAGLAARPLPKVPLAAMVEARATRTMTGTIVRPAAAVVSELPPYTLPFGLRAEAYAQAGYVGGRGATAFVDGQARLERNLVSAGRWQLRAGGGTWGGAQKGAKRLDVGPTATLDVPLGPVTGRLAADWRFRVAGNAAPTSGPALTLSAGF